MIHAPRGDHKWKPFQEAIQWSSKPMYLRHADGDYIGVAQMVDAEWWEITRHADGAAVMIKPIDVAWECTPVDMLALFRHDLAAYESAIRAQFAGDGTPRRVDAMRDRILSFVFFGGDANRLDGPRVCPRCGEEQNLRSIDGDQCWDCDWDEARDGLWRDE
ncbi:hypothetical protein HN371_29425 [Candidatus Poribacteria bacterium]|jgi:hypothetical protein|nr:hypothetical protein [Candidatus Poribacteria bacterium]MBT7096598.1 hypothetical protein [Candidatus Poribacteria bacterium]